MTTDAPRPRRKRATRRVDAPRLVLKAEGGLDSTTASPAAVLASSDTGEVDVVLGDLSCMLDTRIRLSDANVLVLREHRLAGMSPGPASDDSAFGCVSEFTLRGAWTV